MARSDEAEDRGAGLYDAPATGPLSGLSPDQVENRLLRAVLDDLKAGGSLPGLTSNRSKAELGERLRRETGLPLRPIARFLGISKSSYEYWGRRLADGSACAPDEADELGGEVERVFREEGRCARGYRSCTPGSPSWEAGLGRWCRRGHGRRAPGPSTCAAGALQLLRRRDRRRPGQPPLRGDSTTTSPGVPERPVGERHHEFRLRAARRSTTCRRSSTCSTPGQSRGPSGPGPRPRSLNESLSGRAPRCGEGPRRAHRPRLPLPVAGWKSMRGGTVSPARCPGRAGAQTPRWRVLRTEERVLPRQGLSPGSQSASSCGGSTAGWGGTAPAGWGVPRGRRGRLGYHRRQEGEARAGGVAGPRKRPHPLSPRKRPDLAPQPPEAPPDTSAGKEATPGDTRLQPPPKVVLMMFFDHRGGRLR